MRIGFAWGVAMVLSNVSLMPLDRTIYGTTVTTRRDGDLHFQRPFLLEYVMFLAMASCLVLEIPSWRSRLGPRRALHGEEAPAASGSFWPARGVVLKLLVPALCDLLGSWLLFTGALWVPASVVEMMGAANVVFTALLSTTFLGRAMARYEVLGVAVLVLGLLVVGTARVASVSGQGGGTSEGLPAWAPPLGLLLVLLANLFYALEFIVTEKLLGEGDVSAFMSVGVMGLWGVLMFAVLFPVLAATPRAPEAWAPAWHEELGSSLSIVAARPALAAEIVALWAMLLMFNAAAFKTTECLSALTRVVLGQLVSPLVWLLDMALTQLPSSGAAERWTPWSLLQLLGFALLAGGSAAYNGAAPRCCAERTTARSAAGVSLVEAAGADG